MKLLNLKQLRQELNITQVELSRLLDCPQGYLSNIENGKRPANKVLLKKIEDTLGVDVDSYITDIPKSIPTGEPKSEKGTIDRLVSIIESCHEIIRKKDAEIEYLRKIIMKQQAPTE